MFESTIDVKQAMLDYLRQDDTPASLRVTQTELKQLQATAGDRLARVVKELTVLKRFFSRYDERQRKGKRRTLKKGAQFFEALCAFDSKPLLDQVAEELAEVDLEIAKHQAGARERLTERLAEAIVDIDGGKL